MSTRLDGQVALVTGANRGVGKGVALELAPAATARSITALMPASQSKQSVRLNSLEWKLLRFTQT